MKKVFNIIETGSDAREIVMSFIDALNKEDYELARSYVNDDFSFVGVLGSRFGADSYFKDMSKMRFHYDIRKVFAEGNDVCLFYDIMMSGQKIFSCGWYQVKAGKINSFKVIFDPRPILDSEKS